MKTLYAYCDESGNTGLLNNDPNQPILTYSAVIAESNLDLSVIPEIEDVKKLIGSPHIHTKNIDKKILPQCWTILEPALERLNIQFFSCLINKIDFAKLKLFDMFFDSGLNKRVTAFHYGVRANRLPLALNFIQTVDEESIRDFWNHNLNGDYVKMRETIAEIFDNFCAEVRLDPRTRELIIDALDFYMKNSEIFHDSMMKDFSSPNIAGFSLLVQTLHEHYGDEDFRIAEVKHDIQKEFSDQLSYLFNTHGQWDFQRGHMSLISDMERSQLMPPDIVFEKSVNSNGIQLVDFISYLIQSKHKGRLPDNPEFSSFLKWNARKGLHTGLSTVYLAEEVRLIISDLGKKKYSKSALEKGQRIFKMIEEKRKSTV